MTRQALSSPDSQLCNDEPTATRSAERAPGDIPSVSPLVFACRLLAVGRAQEAFDMFEAEIAAGNGSAELQFWMGRAAFSLGNYARAQLALSRAIALLPHDAEAQRWLARVLLRRGNVEGAARVLGRASRSSTPPGAASHLDALSVLLEGEEPDFEDPESEEPPTTQWPCSGGRPKTEPPRE